MSNEWGNLEELEDKREDLLDLISELEIEATPLFIGYCLEKLVVILENIIKKPTEEKYKILKMENNVFYSNIGRFHTGIKLIKAIGFVSVRLENNKLAYKYDVPTAKDIHPLLQIAYDELRITLAKNKSDKLSNDFNVGEFGNDEVERVECSFCSRKFAPDRIDTH